jgi:hypothetical protein
MSIPSGLMKWTLSGKLSGGTERWATSFWTDGHTAADATDASVVIAAGTPQWTAWFASVKTLMATDATITDLDAYFYSGGTAAAAHGHASITPISGTGTFTHPNQIACVMTLRTATATRKGRGRLYLVANGVGIGAGLFLSGAVNAVVDATATFFTGIGGGSSGPVVLSQTAGTSARITSVDADYVPDTQRRRSQKLSSVRHSHTV